VFIRKSSLNHSQTLLRSQGGGGRGEEGGGWEGKRKEGKEREGERKEGGWGRGVHIGVGVL
jgi:hypothetical protein